MDIDWWIMSGMSMQQRIEERLALALELQHLEVVNESGNHQVPPGSESHFKVVLVSDAFSGERLLVRHRRINQALREELAGELHALAIHAYTPDEWRERHGKAPLSPPCLGGSKTPDTNA